MHDEDNFADVQTAVEQVKFKKPVKLRVEDTLAQRVLSVDDAVERLRGFVDTSSDSETQRGVQVLVGTDVNRLAPPSTAPLDTGQTESLLVQAETIIPKVSWRGVFGLSPFERDFYQVGPTEYKIVYVPFLQVLCIGDAEARFTSDISYTEDGKKALDLSLSLKGVGLNYDASSDLSVSFSVSDPVSGAFQLSVPARLETRTYRHRTNDDLTAKRSAIVEVDSEASLVTPGESDFADISNISYGLPKRFGALKNLTKLAYAMNANHALKGTLSFPFLKEVGEFGLTASVSKSTGLEVVFNTTKTGVFKQSVGSDGPLAHLFDATNLEY